MLVYNYSPLDAGKLVSGNLKFTRILTVQFKVFHCIYRFLIYVDAHNFTKSQEILPNTV